jgi:diaminopimelate decarboxylase
VRVQERAARPILVLDAGMNDLIRPAIYDAYHGIHPAREPAAAEQQAYDVVGPICETGDTFTRNRVLAPAMASTYNARALVPEVLVRGDKFAVVRRRWEVADQLALESLPDWIGAGQ